MSIIYEALKKAEEKNVLKKTQPKITAKFRMVFLGLVMIGLGIFSIAGTIVYILHSSSKSAIAYKKRQINSEPKREGIAADRNARLKDEVINTAAAQKNSKYNLQGIIYDDVNPMAIVNGKQIEVGQIVEEALLTQISRNGIEIETEEGIMFIALDD